MKVHYIILGLSRSGSKMLKKILDNHNLLYTVPEMGFYSPFKNSLYPKIKNQRKIKRLRNTNGLLQIINNNLKLKEYLEDFELKEMTNFLNSNPDIDAKQIFEYLVFNKAKNKGNVKMIGAKFPFHFSFVKEFIKWFPKVKIIFLLRDPRAIFASDFLLKTQSRATSKFPIFDKYFIDRIAIMIYTIIQVLWYNQILNKFGMHDNAMIIKYESIVKDSVNSINKLCNFLEVEFDIAMLDIVSKGSSYIKNPIKGISGNSLGKWRTNLNKYEIILFNKLIKTLNFNYKDYLSVNE